MDSVWVVIQSDRILVLIFLYVFVILLKDIVAFKFMNNV